MVSKVLLDGLYDTDSHLSKLLPVKNDVMGDIIWKEMLTTKWEFYPDAESVLNRASLPLCGKGFCAVL